MVVRSGGSSQLEKAALSAIEQELNGAADYDGNGQSARPDDVVLAKHDAGHATASVSRNSADFPGRMNSGNVGRSAGVVSNDGPFQALAFMSGIGLAAQKKPMRLALIFSALWVVLSLGAGLYFYGGDLLSLSDFGGVSSPVLLIINLLITAIPVVAALGMGALYGRVRSMEVSAQSMTHLAQRFVDPESFALDSLASVGQAVGREVAVISESIDRAVSRAGELASRVQHEITVIESSFGDSEAKMRLLVNELKSQGEQVIESGAQMHEVLSQMQGQTKDELVKFEDKVVYVADETLGKLDERFSQMRDTFLGSVDDVLSRLNQELDTRERLINEQLVSTENTISQSMLTTGESIVDAFRRTSADVGESLSGKAADLREILTETSENLVQSLEDQNRMVTGSLQETSQEIVSSIDESMTCLNDSLKATGDSIFVNLSLRANDMSERLETAGNQLTDILETKGHEAAAKFEGISVNLTSALTKDTEQLDYVVNGMIDKFSDQFKENSKLFADSVLESFGNSETIWLKRMNEYSDTITRNQDDAMNNLETHRMQFSEDLKSQSENMSSQLTEMTVHLQNSLEDAGKTMRDTLGRELDQFEDIVQATGDKVGAASQNLSDTVSDFNASLVGQMGNFSSSVAKESDDLSELLTSLSNRVVDLVDTKGREISDSVGEQADRLTEALDKVSGQMKTDVVTTSESMLGVIEESRELFGQSISNSFTSMGQLIEDKAENVTGRLSDILNNADRVLGERSERAAEEITTHVNRVETMFNEDLKDFFTDLDEKTQKAADMMAGRSVEASEFLQSHFLEAAEALKGRAEDINAVLSLRSAEFASLLVDKSDELTKAIQEASAQTLSRFDKAGEVIDATLGDNAERTINQLTLTNEALRGDLNEAVNATSDVVERVNSSSDVLKEILNSASQSLDIVERQIKRRSDDLRSSVEMTAATSREATDMLAEQNSNMRDLSGGLLDKVTELVGRFDQHAGQLSLSAETLERANIRVEGRLSQQQDIMSRVTENMIAKIEDMDTLLKGSVSVINDAMDHSEKRITELTDNVQEKANLSSIRVEDELRKLHNIAEVEASQVGALVKGLYDSLSTEIGKVRQNAAQHGDDILVEFRQHFSRVQSEIHNSLDKTTSDVSHAASELKGVSQTIQKELADTRDEIKRSLSELPRQANTSSEAVREVISDQVKALKALTLTADQSGGFFGDIVQGAGTESAMFGRERASLSGIETSRINDGQAHQQAENHHESKSWMGQVLDRAEHSGQASDNMNTVGQNGVFERQVSRHNVSATEQRGHENFGALTVDIARAVDDDAVNDWWQRFRRGERHPFSRRLYTLPGQAVFDNISERYRTDRLFREAAEKYIRDFEALIKDISKDDSSGEKLQNYLVSNTGKVYTLLLHASNRKG